MGKANVDPAELRRFAQDLNRFNNELDELAQRNRCELLRIDTSRNLAEGLIDYLNKRSLVSIGR